MLVHVKGICPIDKIKIFVAEKNIKKFFLLTSLIFSELSLVGLAVDMVD